MPVPRPTNTALMPPPSAQSVADGTLVVQKVLGLLLPQRSHRIISTRTGNALLVHVVLKAQITPVHLAVAIFVGYIALMTRAISRDDAADGFRPPSSITYHPRRPSSSSVMQQGNPATPLEYADGSNHPAGSRHDPKALSPTETSQAASTNHQKKSFGFLKKMSLGKLRREPVRSRASSTASGSIYNRSSSNLGPEAHHLDPSKLMSPDDLTPQESDEHHQDEHEDPSNPQSPKVQTSHSSHGEAREPNSAATFSSFQPPPSSAASRWSSLRSIMMYLRDVHDLSGDFARVPGNIIASGRGQCSPMEVRTRKLRQWPVQRNFGSKPNRFATFEPPKVTENAQKRSKVMEEIVATEKSYIKGLKELSDIYITSASLMVSGSIGKEKEPVVPPAERKVVFNNKQSAIAMADFKEPASGSDELSKRRQETESQLTNFAAEELARVFIRHAAFLKLYSTYITQFDTALERLPAWLLRTSCFQSSQHPKRRSKERLKTYMKRCRAHPSHTQMNLESYLLMPVQRLPRYKLLLENLVSCTPDLSCTSAREIQSRNLGGVLTDKKPQPLTPNKVAVEALNIVSAVTSEMNERKRDSEGRQRLPHRTLIKEGTMSLMRTVKLTTKDSATIGAGSSHPSARIRPGDGGTATNQSPASLFKPYD
ncbi:hypothetical protein H4Q26_004805 [Puccinia striiformis f. sp. tritici PST-130]|nr:hypothetical protein H4Q26_004805 [Puccinia striiformis f. sp. tritici PST-130]